MHSANPTVTKEVFLQSLGCPTAGWLCQHPPRHTEVSAAALLRMEQGREIGQRARGLFPNGVLVSSLEVEEAAQNTAALMFNTSVNVIFEACFHAGNYVARADILERAGEGWHLIEVKSNVANEEGSKDQLLDDISYTTMVMRQAGVTVVTASLMVISKDYRLGMDDAKLFVRVDLTAEVQKRLAEFLKQWTQIQESALAATKPEPQLIWACKGCGYFENDCVGAGIKHHIFSLPRLSAKKFESLCKDSITTVQKIPDDFGLTDNQDRVRQCVKTGKPFVSKSLRIELSKVNWPAYYLDFETVMTALPLYPETAPYTQFPTQYSLHICSAPGVVVDHKEYLADPSRDCRRDIAERLIADLGEAGTILGYHAQFEEQVIKALATRFADLAPALTKIVERIYDLKKFIADGYYHADFCGSLSIKVVLPVMVPTMRYDNMEIGDGDTAVAMFAKMAQGKCSAGETNAIRANLLNYCKQDTLAMVMVHERLAIVCSARES